MDLDTSIYLRISEATDLFLLGCFTHRIVPSASSILLGVDFPSGRLLLVWENWGESHVNVTGVACSYLSWALLTKTVVCCQVLVSVDLPPLQGFFL